MSTAVLYPQNLNFERSRQNFLTFLYDALFNFDHFYEGFYSSGMLWCVVRHVVSDVSKESVVLIFKGSRYLVNICFSWTLDP